MSGLEIVALVLTGVWLGALTLAMVLIVRQIGWLIVWIDQDVDRGAPLVSLEARRRELEKEGPAVGSRVPREVAFDVPELLDGRTLLLLLSANCTPCRSLAAELGEQPERWNSAEWRVIVLVPGRQELADEVVATLPPSAWSIRDPEAVNVANRLGFQTVPAALVVEDGIVVGKAPLPMTEGAADVARLIEASAIPEHEGVMSHGD